MRAAWFGAAAGLMIACGGSVTGGGAGNGAGGGSGAGAGGASGSSGGSGVGGDSGFGGVGGDIGGAGGDAGYPGTGGTGPIPACCTGDVACGPAYECVNTICEPRLTGGCWRDGDCPPDALCSGAFVCPCTADCAGPDKPGICVPAGGACCKVDQDCGDLYLQRCVSGVCKTPKQGTCWTDADCSAGGACAGATVCPCGAACTQPDQAGTCAYPAD